MDGNSPLHDWVDEFPSPVTVCDVDGKIIAMNNASCSIFSKQGGIDLIGKSLFDCHSDASGRIIRKMLLNESAQTYITENKGKKRLVHQAPWYEKGKFAGLVETIIDLSVDIEVRKRS